MASCFKCSKEFPPFPGGIVSRRDECPSCRTDARCCKNCTFYDVSVYNECREPQAERVLEKERSNTCDYFKLQTGPRAAGNAASAKDEQLKKLDDLFKSGLKKNE